MTAGSSPANSAVPIRRAAQAPLLDLAPLGAALLVEIGRGEPAVSPNYARRSPQTRRIQIDLDALDSGDLATALLTELDRLIEDERPAVLVFSDGLQLFDDPQGVLAQLRERCAADCVGLIAAANATHWSVLAAQLEGRWKGPAGQTPVHLFARQTLADTVREAGWTPVDMIPLIDAEPPSSAVADALDATAKALGLNIERAKVDVSAPGWVARATNGPAPVPMTVAALGMKKTAGVTEARIDHPMAALGSQVSIRATWGAGGVDVPGLWRPGVLILQRQFIDDARFVDAVETRIARGWTVVSEIDDDPAHWPEFAAADHRAFRGVHAISVSTEALADVIRQWNPNIAVFPNAVPYLPETPAGTPKSGERLRVFFGALNRGADWEAIISRISAVSAELGHPFEFTVVHDKAFFDALGKVPKRFANTLPYDDYMEVLADTDIALLPLNDTPFNRLKSDIKLIECAAAGVVPICSPTLYADAPIHHQFALFATTPNDWADALRTLAKDRTGLMQRRKTGLDYVSTQRMQVHQIQRREAVFRDWIAQRPALEAARRERLGL